HLEAHGRAGLLQDLVGVRDCQPDGFGPARRRDGAGPVDQLTEDDHRALRGLRSVPRWLARGGAERQGEKDSLHDVSPGHGASGVAATVTVTFARAIREGEDSTCAATAAAARNASATISRPAPRLGARRSCLAFQERSCRSTSMASPRLRTTGRAGRRKTGVYECMALRGCVRGASSATWASSSAAFAARPAARSRHRAIRGGPPPSRESYLSIENVLAAARKTSADGIHPGYGFLSENAAFARACGEAGLIFIGPPPEAMEEMGEKTRARRKASEAGVPIVPGLTEPIPEGGEEQAKRYAQEIGYPIMLKAAAGGGGKGMRLVAEPREFDAALATAKREALSAFGDARIYIEKAVSRPRHVEIQIFADQHQSSIWLGAGECR